MVGAIVTPAAMILVAAVVLAGRAVAVMMIVGAAVISMG